MPEQKITAAARRWSGEPVRVGVVGAGWGAGLHLEGFRRTGRARLAAITSRTRASAEQTAARYGVERVVDSVDELIDLVDVVTVATPPPAHREPTLAAIGAGRHVLCDKPLAMDAAQAREMLTAAETAGVAHATGFVWRLAPAIGRLREAVAAGDVGAPIEVQTTCALGMPVLPYNWMYDLDQGGGALMQHGTHMIDRVRHLLGQEITMLSGQLHHDVPDVPAGPRFHNVLDAFGWAGRENAEPATVRRPVTADTAYRITGRTAEGVRVSFWETWHGAGPAGDQIVVYGDEATLEWRGDAQLRRHRRGGEPHLIDIPGAAALVGEDPSELGLRLWHRLADHFLDTITGAGDSADLPTLTDGWQVMRVVDAVRASDRSMRWQHL